ncbi:hypothetical protein MY1884_004816 [Beauveria asiatica]
MERRGTKRAAGGGSTDAAASYKRRAPDIDMASIHNGLASLRAQLIRVESALGECAQSGDGYGQAAPPQARPGPGPDPAPHSESASEGPHSGFCGPTSPEYSMNVVRMTLRKRGCLMPPPQHQPALPCFDPDHATPSEPHPWQQPCRAEDQRQLQQFRSRLTLVDAREAVSVYSEVVGDLHDFVDIGSMQDQLSVWYSRSPADGPHPPSNFVHLIIFNLMLAIAARAGTNKSYAASASTMQTVLRSAVDASITSCTPTIKQVTIALLLGHYHIFHDRPQLALRMFGAAGRILMELGIHSGDVIEHVLDTEAQRKEAYRLVCSTVVLDRQWSAMTGLPPNFLPQAFSLRPSYLANSPYSMAMYRLVLMSDKFNEIISLAANKGLGDVDDDTVEVMRFQIRQWQAKAIGEHSVDDLEAWLDHPTLMPQPWALLLIFRASSIHSLLLRSYFFPGSPIDRSRGHVAPATELLSQSIAALAALDASACVFGKHRPYYQHILNSMCALVFLMMGYVHDHRPALSAHLPPDFDGAMRRCLEDAGCLAGRYAAVSTAADRLQKRIKEVCRAADTDAAMSNGGSNAQGSSRTARRSSGSTGTVPIGQRSMRPAAQGQTAAVQAGAPCETNPYIFDTNLHLELSTEMDSCLSQDFQAWGQPIWPSTLLSYHFR